jgi:hypothetical protein
MQNKSGCGSDRIFYFKIKYLLPNILAKKHEKSNNLVQSVITQNVRDNTSRICPLLWNLEFHNSGEE